jgi:hypothetical protein
MGPPPSSKDYIFGMLFLNVRFCYFHRASASSSILNSASRS